MKKLLFVYCACLIFGLTVFGQTSKKDLDQLRKEINLSSSIPLTANDSVFPMEKSIKIYLAIKHNKSAAQEFADWIDEWNRTSGAQYGRLQIVHNISEADIAAVQYRFGVSRVVQEESVSLKVGKTPSGSQEDDKFVLNKVGKSNVKAQSAARNLRVPIYTYLIVRDQNSAWYVNYSRVDDFTSDENRFPDIRLRTEIEGKLKKR